MKNIILFLLILFDSVIFGQSGSLDTTFNVGTGTNSYILTSLIQEDGKIFIGGAFSSYNGTASYGIARLNPDGSIDTSFNTGTGIPWIVTSSALQPDGKIIVGGHFETFNGVSRNKIVRLNTNGSLDLTFNPGTGAYGNINNVSVQPDGKIIIVGDFTSFNGVARQGIARLNADGSLDLGFNSGLQTSNLFSLSLQSDGKVIIGGYFTNYGNVPRNNIARLNSDGSLDTSFNPIGGANNGILSSVIQSDGKIIIGGAFSQYNNTATNHIARLNMDGSLDTSFNSGTANGLDYYSSVIVHAITLQPDGKIIIGGEFSSYNGIERNYLLRLHKEGDLDTSFDPVKGPNNQVRTISIQSDGKLIIAGGFSEYNHNSTRFIARINNDLFSPITTPQSFCISAVVSDLKALGTNLKCYTTEIGGTPLTLTTSLSTATYYVSQTIDGIESSRAAVPVTINTPITPIFAQVNDICIGTSLQPLPTISTNGIPGYWSPELNNTTTTTYTFTPSIGFCATTNTMTITVNQNIIPTFTQFAPVCSGEIIPTLPTISNNNITGTWSPIVNNTTTTTYTFTPSTGSCATTAKMDIVVLPKPNVELNHTEILCRENNEMIELNAGLISGLQSQYSYEWYRNDTLLPSEKGYYLSINQDGIYSCKIIDNSTACKSIRTNNVFYSEIVTIEKIIISDLALNNTVTVIATGSENIEYSLDMPSGPFQISNIFDNVEAGFHTVYVKDKNDCGNISKMIAVIGAPLYFTPNNDGYNDKWKIKGINNQFFKNFKISIFDRYGKLLKVILNSETEGWDGTYNGYPLPADDYWFIIDLEDGRTAKGHFSLKR